MINYRRRKRIFKPEPRLMAKTIWDCCQFWQPLSYIGLGGIEIMALLDGIENARATILH